MEQPALKVTLVNLGQQVLSVKMVLKALRDPEDSSGCLEVEAHLARMVHMGLLANEDLLVKQAIQDPWA